MEVNLLILKWWRVEAMVNVDSQAHWSNLLEGTDATGSINRQAFNGN